MDDVIQGLKRDHDSLLSELTISNPSLAISVEATMAKVLLLATASHLEKVIGDILLEYYAERTSGDEIAVEFVRNKAVSRQFHSYFQWDRNNANNFFGLFGTAFKDAAISRVKADSAVESAIRAFLELGSLRNQLVHQNYAVFVLTKTAEEIVTLYEQALRFTSTLRAWLREGT